MVANFTQYEMSGYCVPLGESGTWEKESCGRVRLSGKT